MVGPGAGRTIAVRIPFRDERAARFLHDKAAQLPPGLPGLLFFDVSHPVGGYKHWSRFLLERLQRHHHTRVGVIVLAEFALGHIEGGFGLVHRTRIIENPHAAVPVPWWLLGGFTVSDGDKFEPMPLLPPED